MRDGGREGAKSVVRRLEALEGEEREGVQRSDTIMITADIEKNKRSLQNKSGVSTNPELYTSWWTT